MKVLIVEDDNLVAESISLALKKEGISSDIEAYGEEVIDLLKTYSYDLIILDLMLPDINGYDVLEKIRTAEDNIPVLILSGLQEADNKIKGLSSGADDYLVKPFNGSELIARVKAIIRRYCGYSTSIIKCGRLSIDLNAKIAYINKRQVKITNKEYEILELLALKKGRVMTKDMFFNHLYSGIDEPDFKIIDVFICKLRKKLSQESGGINFIETIWGRGYILRDPDAIIDLEENSTDKNYAQT